MNARYWGWTPLEPLIPADPGREEALFWLLALDRSRAESTPSRLAETVADIRTEDQLGDEALFGMAMRSHLRGGEPLSALGALLPPRRIVELLLEDRGADRETLEGAWALARGVGDRLRPALDPFVLAEVRDLLHECALDSPPGLNRLAAFVAAQLGADDGLRSVVAGWADGVLRRVPPRNVRWIDQLLAIDSSAALESEWDRLAVDAAGLAPFHLRRWLARTGEAGLMLLRQRAFAGSRQEAALCVEVVARSVHQPAAAPVMLELLTGSKATQVARRWLDTHPLSTATGLAPLLKATCAETGRAVQELRRLKRAGHADALVEAKEHLDPADAAGLDAHVLDHEEPTAPALEDTAVPLQLRPPDSTPRLPRWLSPDELPPLLVGEGRLDGRAVAGVLERLRECTLDRPGRTVDALREHCDAASADAFAWALFEQWIAAGAPAHEGWAMRVLAFLAQDGSTLRLAELVRGWPEAKQHKRAAAGLEVLSTIGSDTALGQIHEIGRRVRSKALRERARAAMTAIARSRGLSEEDLLDRVVPGCGLDARGTRTFAFGDRRLEFVLSPGLRPMLRELDERGRPTGALRSMPPRPAGGDDVPESAAAREEWRAFKKQVTSTLKLQADRLERAMRLRRRWSPEDFDRLFVRHPLQIHLVRSVLWGAWVPGSPADSTRRLDSAFRVTEEMDLATAEDRTYAIPPSAAIGVVHPLDLDVDSRAAWLRTFEDYELVPPFPQLDRPVHVLEPREEKATELVRPGLLGITSGALMGVLMRRGWDRIEGDGGLCRYFERHLPAAGIIVTLESAPGIWLGEPHASGDQDVVGCSFRRDGTRGRLGLGQVDAVVVSETLVDLSILGTKAGQPS